MRGAAVMEVSYVDIEVNIFSEAQVTTLGEKQNVLSSMIDYFCCLKQSDGEWFSDDYLGHKGSVDWNAPDWEDQQDGNPDNIHGTAGLPYAQKAAPRHGCMFTPGRACAIIPVSENITGRRRMT